VTKVILPWPNGKGVERDVALETDRNEMEFVFVRAVREEVASEEAASGCWIR